MRIGKLIGAICLALILIVGSASAETVESVTSAETYTPNTYEPDPWISGNVTISDYNFSYESSGVFAYEDDGGDEKTLPFVIDSNVKNPVCVNPSKIVSPNGLQASIVDPSTNGTSWINASSWVVIESYGGNPVVSKDITKIKENGVEKLRMKVVSNATANSGGKFTLTLNEDIVSDLSKQKLIVGIEFVSWDSNSTVYIMAFDTSAAKNQRVYGSGNNQIVASQGDIVFFELSLNGRSDLDYIRFEVDDMDTSNSNTVEIKVFAMAVQVKYFGFGKDNASNTVHNMTVADNGLMCMMTFGPSFEYDSVASFGPIAFHAPASKLEAKYTNVSVADYSGGDYVKKGIYNLSMNVPKAIDLTYVGLTLEDKLLINSQQYDYVSVAGTQKTSTFTGARKGDIITVKSSLSEGTRYLMEYEILFTQDQWEGISEEVGALYGSSSDSWWNKWWLWLASLLGIGYGVNRKRKTGA